MASETFVVDDRYEVGDVLGRGGMGEVRRARDRRLHRDVAIKFLRTDLAAQPEARQRFAEEARSAARLTHPNVVLVLDTGDYAGQPYLVMECLPGKTLHDELRGGPLDEARATAVACDVLAGLAAAHAIGIIHRDVSPANILLTVDGRAKIADFGIAKTTEGLVETMVGQVLGTPAYVAPERLQGDPATPASDVYALGVTLYEALSGDRPFKGDSAVAVAQAVLSTTPTPLRDVNPELDPDLASAVDNAMYKNPERRPTAESLLARISPRQAEAAPDLGDSDQKTEAIPIVDATVVDDDALKTVGVGAPPATDAVAAPLYAPPRREGREMRAVWITVAAAALLGALLLAVTNGSGGSPDDSEAPPAASVTTVATTPTTVASAPAVRVTTRVTAVRVAPGKQGAGKGAKHGKK